MARILGVDIPNEKQVEIALTYIYGIGPVTAKKIVATAKIDPQTRAKDLSQTDISKIYEYIEKNLTVEGELRQRIFQHIKRLRDIRSYRGMRHKVGLPVRGQNTRKNARTRKGRSKIAVGGLNKPVSK
jgi:small subunit ribosomal protein S13